MTSYFVFVGVFSVEINRDEACVEFMVEYS